MHVMCYYNAIYTFLYKLFQLLFLYRYFVILLFCYFIKTNNCKNTILSDIQQIFTIKLKKRLIIYEFGLF